eukprot:CAMPEP_0204614126 /NCGR_PEP_ID=MMETSP0717-20131115/1933_1 /ASSEMBLY_ACC=CAM_ASM_000666 /TAXON_ID=230516 /ORGANISM="Chaetoceros curvisetus" /LENGTH=261 /DNA_ID=CAMNT_0051626723 /DNA_START=50 /DNA_END=835 /DNA_ORIENTATION=+
MAPKGVNAKKQKGMELKAANKAVKDKAAAAAREQQEAAEWKKGSNVKKAARDGAAAEKADLAAKKRAEKAALLAAEEEGLSSNTKAAKVAAKKGKKKKGGASGFDLLEATLVGDAEKKTKAAKKTERLRKEREERLRKEREKVKAQKEAAAQKKNPLMANTDAMIGNAMGMEGNGKLNRSLAEGEVAASGMDQALNALSIGGGAVDEHPEKRMKALHKAFEERMMPQMKEEYPGLKRSQYIEKIFAMWKKSPDNPMNWPKA